MEYLQSLKMVIGMLYCYPSDAEIPRKQSICGHQCMLFHRKTTRNTFKSCKVEELQHPSKKNEEGTSLPDETGYCATTPPIQCARGY